MSSRPGRPPADDFYRQWKIHLPATLAGQVEFLLLDPVHGKPRYGARAKLMEKLLSDFMADEAKVNSFLLELNTLSEAS